MAKKKITKRVLPPPKKGGQPKFKPNYDLVRKVAGLFPTDEEMAVVLGCSRNTVLRLKREDEEYQRIIEECRQGTRMKLRQLQMREALGGNITMLIYLGKQLLGQSDKQVIESTVVDKTPQTIDLTPKQLEAAMKALKSDTQ